MNQTGIRITKLLIHESGTYNPQYRRPYETTLDRSTLGALQERLDGSQEFSPAMMSGVANQFIRPQATPEREVNIVQGWGERRARFMMEVEHQYMTGGVITEVILGYTNYWGLGTTGSIDPRMEFYVNSTMHIRNSIERSPMGNQIYSSVIDSSHVMADNNWGQGGGIYNPEKDHRMRPVDVFSTMSRSHLPNAEGILDMRTALTNTAVKSRRSNSMAANYMATILDTYKNANATQEFGVHEQDILSQARGLVAENPATSDPFLSAVAQVRGTSVGNVFSYGDLLSIDPGVDHVTVVQFMADAHRAQVHQAGQTQHWGGADLETHTATILSQAVPSLLMSLMLTGIGFKSTNRTVGGQIHTSLFDVVGFSSVDLTPFAQQFKVRVEHEILKDLTFNNSMDFAIEMKVDLLGETWIRVSLNSGPMIDYVVPSFCDSLTVPVLTTNANLATRLATDFDMLFEQVRENTIPGMTGNTVGVFGGL
jgi:hypothetical protein